MTYIYVVRRQRVKITVLCSLTPCTSVEGSKFRGNVQLASAKCRGNIFSDPWGPPSLYHRYHRYQGVTRTGRGFDQPSQSTAEVKEKLELFLSSPPGASRSAVRFNLPLHLNFTFLRKVDVYLANYTASRRHGNPRCGKFKSDYVPSIIDVEPSRFVLILIIKKSVSFRPIGPNTYLTYRKEGPRTIGLRTYLP